jgi:2-oxoglutarate dehydrogenase complex dihydrolipoamide succinyltransferase (E2) component
MPTNIIMPEMGEGVIEGTVVTWLKKEGDVIEEDEAVLEVETDKVTVEINAEVAGTLLQIIVDEGTTVEVGDVLAVIGEAGEQPTPPTPKEAPKREPVAQMAAAPQTYTNGIDQPSSAPREVDGIRFSPVVARMVQEHDLDITKIKGTGRDGRITKRDVLAYMETADVPKTATTPKPTPTRPVQTNPPPKVDPSEGEIVPLTGMRRAIAEHMVMSKATSPHVTTVFEFDYSAVAAHRAAHKAQFQRDGVKLTYMPYLIQATVEALKKHPMVNASWTDDGVLLKRDIHMGIAVAVDKGLLVPVIRNADTLNLFGLARAVNDFAERARSNRIKSDELRNGSFSITNHGASGSLIGTPIINQPQVGILGIGVIEKRVKVINDAIAIRPCAFVSFSFDHRILDGATADAFVMDIKRRIEHYE